MVAQWGMSKEVGPMNFGDDERQPFLGYSLSQGRSYSEETAARIDGEVRKMIDRAYEQTVKLLSANRERLDTLAHALLDREIITREEMFDLIGLNHQPGDDDDVTVPDLPAENHTTNSSQSNSTPTHLS
jgi:cell division protease FtsH